MQYFTLREGFASNKAFTQAFTQAFTVICHHLCVERTSLRSAGIKVCDIYFSSFIVVLRLVSLHRWIRCVPVCFVVLLVSSFVASFRRFLDFSSSFRLFGELCSLCAAVGLLTSSSRPSSRIDRVISRDDSSELHPTEACYSRLRC